MMRKKISCMLFSWLMGCSDEKKASPRGRWAAEIRRVEQCRCYIHHPKRVHTLVYTEEKWFPFAEPVQQTGWIVDIKISSPYVVTGQQHKVRNVVNSGTRLCSYVPNTKNVVISESYTLKTNNARQGLLRMVSEFSPAEIIGLGLATSTILLEIVLGNRPDDCWGNTWLQARVDPSAC